jgi:hypothetical protein
MSQPQALNRVVQVLDGLGIDYLVSGTLACTVQGGTEPAPGIHLVVALTPDKVNALLAAFDPHAHHLKREAVEQAVRPDSAVRAFTLLCLDEDEAVAFWVLTGDPFDQARFGRKVAGEVSGVPVKLSAPEDTILAKLQLAQLTGGGSFSEEQLAYARSVYRRHKDHLDRDYLKTWAAHLGIEQWCAKLQAEPARPPRPRWSVRLTRKHFVYGALGALAVVCGLILFIGYVSYCPIEANRVVRIQRGMTERQVEAILGRPCTEVMDFAAVAGKPMPDELAKKLPGRVVKTWQGRRAACNVWFDADERVTAVSFWEFPDSGPIGRLRDLIGF